MPSSFRRLFAVSAIVLGFAALAVAPVAHAQSAAPLPRKELTEAVSTAFTRLQPLIDAKNYPAALRMVRQLLAEAPEKSYDVFVLSQVQAQVLLAQNKLAEAIAPLERVDALAEGNANFFDASARLERLNLLAQLHYHAATEKKTASAQRAGYQKALAYLRRCAELGAKPAADTLFFSATIRYSLATLDPAKPNQRGLREAAADARQAILLSAKPNRQARVLLAACHQQLDEIELAAEQFEVIAAEDPKDASNWSQLQSLYLGAAAATKDPEVARAQNIRALITIERAQSHGHLLSPKDHYAKVAILYHLRRFARAAEILEKGLGDGSIENTEANWELLASSYQQAGQEEKSFDAYERAVERFPARADLELTFAQALYSAGKIADAYERASAAVAKPGLEKPAQARLYLAFLAYELRRYEDAARWIAEVRAAGGVPAADIDPIARAIDDALAVRAPSNNS